MLSQESADRANTQSHVVPRGTIATAEQDLVEATARKLGLGAEYDAWARARREQGERMLGPVTEEQPERDVTEYLREPMPAFTRSVGEMWWARTNVGFPSGMNAEFRPDDLHLFGQVAGVTGTRWGDNWSKCWLHTAQFVRVSSHTLGGASERLLGILRSRSTGRLSSSFGSAGRSTVVEAYFPGRKC